MADTVPEGCTSYHPYRFLDADGDEVASVESARYKLSSATETLVDWTAIPGTAATGTIEVSADDNIAADATDLRRYLTLEATHGGGKKIVDEKGYVLKNFVGIVPEA